MTHLPGGMRPVEAGSGNFYEWGAKCSGWRLLELDHLQVRKEAMPPGTAEEPHVHRHAHQFFYVLAGRMTLLAPDRTVLLRAGQGVHVPAGQPHWVRNDGDRVLRFLLASGPRATDDRTCVDTADWKAAAP